MLAPPHERTDQEQRAPDLAYGIGDRERQSGVAKGPGDRGREDETAEHQQDQHQPDRPEQRIDPVRRPVGVIPHPPRRHQEQADFERAPDGEVVQQGVRQLGDREHEDQVEEQLDRRDPAGVLTGPIA